MYGPEIRTKPSLIEEVYEVGPRKITTAGRTAIVILGDAFKPLIGRRALVVIKVLKELPSNQSLVQARR